MNLTDDFLLAKVSQERANAQIACYVNYMMMGNTLLFKIIKAASMATYVRNLATLIIPVRGNDPRYVCPTDRKMAPIITNQLDKVRKWESLPDRREPCTLDMILDIVERAKAEPDDGIVNAIQDNFITAIYGGYRCSEWAQGNKTHSAIGTHHLSEDPNKDGKHEAYAFTLGDISFRNDKNAPIPLSQIVNNPSRIPALCFVCFKHQKNDNHGEKRKFARNDEKPHLCFIRAMMRIIQRFIRLIGWNFDLPLSVYYSPETGETLNITSAEIEHEMQLAAIRVYELDPTKKDHLEMIKKWTAHSLRVGACVLLYTSGFSDTEIKFLLRWKSDSFRDYLRNLAFTARKQNSAINAMSVMPNFL